MPLEGALCTWWGKVGFTLHACGTGCVLTLEIQRPEGQETRKKKGGKSLTAVHQLFIGPSRQRPGQIPAGGIWGTGFRIGLLAITSPC